MLPQDLEKEGGTSKTRLYSIQVSFQPAVSFSIGSYRIQFQVKIGYYYQGARLKRLQLKGVQASDFA
jgi:hypothetical protein